MKSAQSHVALMDAIFPQDSQITPRKCNNEDNSVDMTPTKSASSAAITNTPDQMKIHMSTRNQLKEIFAEELQSCVGKLPAKDIKTRITDEILDGLNSKENKNDKLKTILKYVQFILRRKQNKKK